MLLNSNKPQFLRFVQKGGHPPPAPSLLAASSQHEFLRAPLYVLDPPLLRAIHPQLSYKISPLSSPFNQQTQFLVTHGIGFLPQCDQIIVMEGGRITEAGPYAELIDAGGDFAEFIRTFTAMEENQEGDPCGLNWTNNGVSFEGCPALGDLCL